MANKRKKYNSGFKARIALEAIKADKTLAEISNEYAVHATQINKWKRKVLEELPSIFSDKREKENKEAQKKEEELYRQIGQLTVELDWVKKKAGLFS